MGGWKGGFSKMGQAEMVMAYGGRPPPRPPPRPQPFAFLNFSGWEGGRVDFQKRGQDEMEICLGWEGGRVDFQKWSKQRL